MQNLYVETARLKLATEPLLDKVTADVAIVGGGYTGLSTALHLAEQGISAVVVEAGEIGHGCSGRNGGQVNPGLKLLPDKVEKLYGAEAGSRLVRLADSAPGEVFGLIAKHEIDCSPSRTGTIRAAIDPAGWTHINALVHQSTKRNGPVRLLDEAGMKLATGTDIYLGGALDARGGHINPLGYARGLAVAAQRAGAKLHSQSLATSLSQEGRNWIVKTPNGSVSAPELVIGTNGYTGDLWPGLKKTIAPIYTYITATDPLPATILKSIMPCGAALFEAAWDVIYYRIDDAGRLIMGGRGAQRDAVGKQDYRHLVAYAVKLWPQLRGIDWPWHWYGQVAITQDHLPHLIAPDEGVHLMLGYNGRGIGMATVAGRLIAERIASNRTKAIDLPVREKIQPMRLQRFWKMGAEMTMAAHIIRDRMAGR